MSVEISASGEALSIATPSVPVDGAWTVMCWVNTGGTGGSPEIPLFVGESGSVGAAFANVTGDDLDAGHLGGTTSRGVVITDFYAAANNDKWAFLCMTREDTGGSYDEAHWYGRWQHDIALTQQDYTNGFYQSDDTNIWLGRSHDYSAENHIGEFALFRAWDVELTPAEILTESKSSTPVKTANLVSDIRLADLDDNTERVTSGLGPFTETGAVADGSTDPVPEDLGLTVTVHKTTGDYSTVQSAVDDCSVLIGTGWYKVEIQDAVEYNERLTITAGEITTPSISHYLWLTAASGVRHDGTPGTGHARMKHNWENVFVQVAYTRLDYLQFETGTTAGREAIKVMSGANNVLISHCVVKAGYSNASGVMIESGNLGPMTVSIDNCVIFGAGDAGVIINQQPAGGSDAYTFNIDHCTILKNGNDTSDVNAGAVVVYGDAAGTDATINLYNTIAAGTVNDTDVAVNDSTTRDTITSGGTAVWNGTHNLHTSNTDDIDGTGITDNTTNWQDASAGGSTVTTTTANAVIVTNLTDNAEDFTLLAATGGGSNLAVTNGTDRIGSEPDARQDFSLDIAGNTRPTTNVDIGAFQISAAGGGTTLEQEGFRFYEATSTEGTNALAAQDVNITRGANETVRLRTLLNATGDPASTQWKLQFRDPTGTWRDLGAGE